MIHLMIDPRTGETVRFMQNDIVSVPTLEKGARLYITKNRFGSRPLTNMGRK